MSLFNIDDMSADFDCLHCGHKLEETIARLKSQPRVTCPQCGKITEVELGGVDESQRKIDEASASFEKTLRDFGKRR